MAENRTVYNNISDTLKEKVEKRIKDNGSLFNFKLTTGRTMRMPTMQAGVFVDRTVWNSAIGLPDTDTINDEGGQKNLAVVRFFDGNGMPVMDTRYVMAEATNGTFSLNYNVPQDAKWLEHLLVSNYVENGCNPNPVPGKVMMKIVDDIADAKKDNERLDKKEAAMLTAAGMDDVRRREFAAAMNWNQDESSEILKSKIRNLADKDPEFFTSFIDKGLEYKALLKKAIDAKVVSFEPTTNELRWANGEPFATLSKEAGKNELDKFQDWVNTGHPNASEIAKTMRTALAKNKSKP